MAIVMNKVATKSKRALKFDDLKRGDIFLKNNSWFIKTIEFGDDCGDPIGNAINLIDGDYAYFDYDETVTKLKKNIVFDYSSDDITDWYDN